MLKKTQIKHKLKKAVLIGTALFMAAGTDNGWAVGNLAKTVTVHAKSIVKADGEPTKKALNVLTYDNKIQPECNEHYIVEIKRDEAFPSGYDAYVKEMEQTDVDDYTKKLNKFLQSSNSEVADVAHPVNIGVTDETGEDAKDIGKTTVRIYTEKDTDQLNGFDLYHFKDKDEPEKINYKTGKDEEKNGLQSYIEFKTDSFSPFLFVKTKPAKKAEQNETKTNDLPDMIADESNAETVAEAPSTLDIHFKTLAAQLFKGADKGDDGIYKWNVASYDLSQHRFNFRINYALSGSDKAKEGSVRMKIPKNILQSRDGLNADSYELSIPSQSDVEKYQSGQGDVIAADAKFAYYEDGDSIVIYNFREMHSGDNGYIELAYKTTRNIIDYNSNDIFTFTCAGEILDGDKIASTSSTQNIRFKINTSAKLSYISCIYPSKYKDWKSNLWGDGIKPENDEDYFYLVWRVDSNTDAITQYYDFSLDANVTGSSDDMTGAMKVLGYKFGGNSWSKLNTVKNQSYKGIRHDYILTCVKKSEFNKATKWEATSNVTATMTSIDTKEKTSKTGKATWTWELPSFGTPFGKFNTYQRGDGAYRSSSPYDDIFRNATHFATSGTVRAGKYSRFDLGSFNGFDDEPVTMTEYDGFDFASWIIGYSYLWTYDYDNYDEKGKDPKGYGKKPVDFEFTNKGVFLTNGERPENEQKRTGYLDSDDFCFYKMDYSWFFKDALFDEDAQKLKGTNDVIFKDGESLKFYGQFGKDTEKKLFLTHDLKTGNIWFDSNYVSSVENGTITFKDGVDLVAYAVKTSNVHYYTEIYTIPFVKLKNSKTVMDFVKGQDEIAVCNTNQGFVYSPNAEKTPITWDGKVSKGNLVFETSETDCDFARTTKRESSLLKRVSSSSNNAKKKQFSLTWTITQNEKAMLANDDDTSVSQSSGTFFDLLPKGTTLDKESIQVKDGTQKKTLNKSEYIVKTISNYKKTGRTMLVVKITSEADSYELSYDTLYSWDSVHDYGEDVYNPVAYKTGNKAIAGGFTDNGGAVDANGKKNPHAIQDAELMSGLDAIDIDSTQTGKNTRYIFAENRFNATILTSVSSGLSGKVKEERDNEYSQSSATKISGNYSYSIRYQGTVGTHNKNTVLFDSLENYTGNKAEGAMSSDWRGILQSIDTKQIEEAGIKPVVYISTIPNLNIDENNDVQDSSVWQKVTSKTDLSQARAVAIDISKAKDGSNYETSESQSFVAYLYMKAPSSAVLKEDGSLPYAYNNVYISTQIIDANTGASEKLIAHNDYTKISLAVSGSFGVRKVSSESSNVKVRNAVFHLYGTSNYGTVYDETAKTNKYGELYFNDIEMGSYILQEQEVTEDWVLDITEHIVNIDNSGVVQIDEQDYTNKYIQIENSPRIHSNVTFKKADITNTYIKLKGAQFMLSGTSEYGTPVTQYLSSNENGTVSFKNIEKGTYELKETKAPDGYVLNQNVYSVTIGDEGDLTIKMKRPYEASTIDVIQSNGEYIITGESLHDFTFYTVSTWDSSVLSQAKYILTGTSDFGTKIEKECFSDKNGKVSFKGLEKGLYTLREVSAPSGYQLDDQSYLIQINTVKEGDSGEPVIANGIGTDEKVLDGKVFVLYNAPETGTMSITKVWDDGEEDRDPASLNIVLTTDKPSQYYASRTITFDANGGNFGGTDKNQVLYGVSKAGQIQTTISGTMLLPTKAVSRFDYWDKTSEAKSYWTTNPDGTGDRFFSVADDVSHVVDKDGNIPLLTHDMVLYAQYQKLDPQLLKGTEFNKLIPEDAVRIEFTDEKAPEDAVLTDVSEGKDGGVVAWSETAIDENNDEIKVWKVSSQVKGLKIKFPKECCGMFSTGGLAACKKDLHFKTVDFKNVDTSKTTNLSSMFAAWYSNSTLEHVFNMNQFDTSNVTDMSTMFANCSHLKDVDFSSFDVSKVQSFNNFLYSCGSLTSIDVSGFDIQSAKSLFNMFYGCGSLKSLDVSSFNTLSADDMGGMFAECRGLQTIDITNFDTRNVRNFNNMFFNCRKLKEIKWDNTKFTTESGIDFGSMFLFDGVLSVPDVSHFNMEKAASINNMFYGTPVEVIDTSKWNAKNITRMDSMFRTCGNLKSVDLTGIDTSKVTNMSFLFDGCGKLANIKGLSDFNTSNVTDMTGMFAGLSAITELDISNFDTSKVVKFGDSTPYSAISSYGQPGMFQNCSNLRTLHIGEMDLSSAKNFSRMFSGCSSLETIDGTFVNGNVVEDLNTMFTDCRQLQTIDISGLNVANATNTKYMFYGCSLLETIISNNFEAVSITDDQEMFAQCPNLPNFDTAQTGSSMAVSQEEGGYLTKPKQKTSVILDAVQKLASLLS